MSERKARMGGERDKSVTLVFSSSVRCDPFHIETPYGHPHSVSIGDVIAQEAIFREALEEIAEGDKWSDAGEMSKIAQVALAKVEAMTAEELRRPKSPAPAQEGGRDV